MTGRALFAVAAATASLAIMGLVLLATNWLAEAAMPFVLVHLKPIAMFASPFAAMTGTFAALSVVYAGYKKRKVPEEEPRRPRIRNGQI
jgi:hypothetical protein